MGTLMIVLAFGGWWVAAHALLEVGTLRRIAIGTLGIAMVIAAFLVGSGTAVAGRP